jgi:DNA modification methylase
MLTLPGELVLDPFVGHGTTPAAAVAEPRRFLGCDVDPAAVSLTIERLNEIPDEHSMKQDVDGPA